MTMLAHEIQGQGPTVVLLHPIATRREIWLPQVGPWSARLRVLRVDLPGHGQSPLGDVQPLVAGHARAVWALLDALGEQRVMLVGLSFGGMVAQAMALQRPQQLKALVLAHTSAHTDARVRALWEQRLADLAQQGMAAHACATLGRWFTPGFAERAPLTVEWVGRMVQETPEAGYRAAVRAIQALDHGDLLAQITAPTLVVAGGQDLAIPVEAARTMAQRMPGARLEVIPQAAHLGNIEQPEAFTETVGGFLAQQETA